MFVHRTKDEIKHAPEYDDTMSADMTYRARLQGYYGPEGAGYRESETRDHLHVAPLGGTEMERGAARDRLPLALSTR